LILLWIARNALRPYLFCLIVLREFATDHDLADGASRGWTFVHYTVISLNLVGERVRPVRLNAAIEVLIGLAAKGAQLHKKYRVVIQIAGLAPALRSPIRFHWSADRIGL